MRALERAAAARRRKLVVNCMVVVLYGVYRSDSKERDIILCKKTEKKYCDQALVKE
jgi:hypothetical protein